MAERKKYPYDEKARKRITKCLKENYAQLRVSVKKDVKKKYKAYAAFKGLSLSEIIIRHLEEMIERDGFVYEPETDDVNVNDAESGDSGSCSAGSDDEGKSDEET